MGGLRPDVRRQVRTFDPKKNCCQAMRIIRVVEAELADEAFRVGLSQSKGRDWMTG